MEESQIACRRRQEATKALAGSDFEDYRYKGCIPITIEAFFKATCNIRTSQIDSANVLRNFCRPRSAQFSSVCQNTRLTGNSFALSQSEDNTPQPTAIQKMLCIRVGRQTQYGVFALSKPTSSIARGYSSTLASGKPNPKLKYVPSSGTYPKGFNVGGIHCGVKKDGKSLDLALVTSELPCTAAAVFTKNVFKAAPVVLSRQMLDDRHGSGVRAIVANSGCANAVTGKGGLEDGAAMGKTVDALLGETDPSTVIMSTGVIGQRLPIQKILDGIPTAFKQLSTTHESWTATAKAICTTDTFPKFASKTFTLPCCPGTTYSIAGMAKGAGMIHPNMATLLGFMATDAPVVPEALQKILTHAVARSFNAISVDGDMSTNDTVAILANGAAAPKSTKPVEIGATGYEELQEVVTEFSEELAKLVVRDGEGATKFVTVRVVDAESFEDAKQVASTIVRSPLVKTALYGRDANWGRILCATGYSGVTSVDPEKTNVSFMPTDGSAELKLLINGEPENVNETRASEILDMEDLEIRVSLGTGGGQEAVYYTCDFSHEYITINGDYRT